MERRVGHKSWATHRHRPVDEVEVRHLLAELLLKLPDDRSSQELLGGKTQDVSEDDNNIRLLSVFSHRHSVTHTLPLTHLGRTAGHPQVCSDSARLHRDSG